MMTTLSLSLEELCKYKECNTEMLPEISEFYNANRNKIIKNNLQWRKVEQRQEHNWIIHKKFNQSDDEKLYSQFRSILNKLTESNFNEMAKELTQQEITKRDHLDQLVQFIFSKSILEHKFCITYAKLSKELSKYCIEEEGNTVYFRELLINKCQAMFAECISADQPTSDEDVENRENTKTKQEIIGCMTLISELYNNDLLTAKIINSCLLLLMMRVNTKKPYLVESILTIIKIAGKKFSANTNEMTAVFDRLVVLSKSDQITNKDKYMLFDLFDIKDKEGW